MCAIYDATLGTECSRNRDCSGGEVCLVGPTSDESLSAHCEAPLGRRAGGPALRPSADFCDTGCANGFCLQDGVCSTLCRADADCPAGWLCFQDTLESGQAYGYCVNLTLCDRGRGRLPRRRGVHDLRDSRRVTPCSASVSTPPGAGEVGAACRSSDACRSGSVFRSVCSGALRCGFGLPGPVHRAWRVRLRASAAARPRRPPSASSTSVRAIATPIVTPDSCALSASTVTPRRPRVRRAPAPARSGHRLAAALAIATRTPAWWTSVPRPVPRTRIVRTDSPAIVPPFSDTPRPRACPWGAHRPRWMRPARRPPRRTWTPGHRSDASLRGDATGRSSRSGGQAAADPGRRWWRARRRRHGPVGSGPIPGESPTGAVRRTGEAGGAGVCSRPPRRWASARPGSHSSDSSLPSAASRRRRSV
jgi:hypothetical protein